MVVGPGDLPPEVWIQILIHLSPADLLALKFTTHHLQSLITAQARQLTNTLILTYHSVPAFLLQTAPGSHGWLIPHHAAVLSEEERISKEVRRHGDCGKRDIDYRQVKATYDYERNPHASSRNPLPTLWPNSWSEAESDTFSSFASSTNSTSSSSSSQSSVVSNVTFPPRPSLLTEAGPQYLFFLEMYGTNVRIGGSMFLSKLSLQEQMFTDWVGLYCVRKSLHRLRRLKALEEKALVKGHWKRQTSDGTGTGREFAYARVESLVNIVNKDKEPGQRELFERNGRVDEDNVVETLRDAVKWYWA